MTAMSIVNTMSIIPPPNRTQTEAAYTVWAICCFFGFFFSENLLIFHRRRLRIQTVSRKKGKKKWYETNWNGWYHEPKTIFKFDLKRCRWIIYIDCGYGSLSTRIEEKTNTPLKQVKQTTKQKNFYEWKKKVGAWHLY